MDHTPLYFAQLDLDSVFASNERFAKEIAANYIADAVFGSLALIGSLELIGNPTLAIQLISSGVRVR